MFHQNQQVLFKRLSTCTRLWRPKQKMATRQRERHAALHFKTVVIKSESHWAEQQVFVSCCTLLLQPQFTKKSMVCAREWCSMDELLHSPVWMSRADIFIPFLDVAEGTFVSSLLAGVKFTSRVDDNHARPFLFTSLAAIIPNYSSFVILLSVTWAQAMYWDKSSYDICCGFKVLSLLYWAEKGIMIQGRI